MRREAGAVFDAAGVDYPSPDWTTEDYIKLTKAISDPSKGVWGGDRTKDAFRAIWHNYDAQVYSDDSTSVAALRVGCTRLTVLCRRH